MTDNQTPITQDINLQNLKEKSVILISAITSIRDIVDRGNISSDISKQVNEVYNSIMNVVQELEHTTSDDASIQAFRNKLIQIRESVMNLFNLITKEKESNPLISDDLCSIANQAGKDTDYIEQL